LNVETYDIASQEDVPVGEHDEHVVQFYAQDAETFAAVGAHLSAAIREGCAYPTASVAEEERRDALIRVCRMRSAVLARARVGAPDATPALFSELRATYPPSRESPGKARRLLARTLERYGCERAKVEAAALVASELASNAVRHAGSRFSLELSLDGAAMRLAVEDEGPAPCGPAEALRVRPTHGLAIVEALSLRWGVERTAAGKVVWAELPA
jgi:anti-sigma regulatory factor (Ser/Thr protein kinase)